LGNTFKCKFSNEYELQDLIEDIYRATFIVAHNAKFELAWLVRAGLDLSRVVVWDTMIGDYVIGGNRYGGKKGTLTLEACLRRRGLKGKESVVSTLIHKGCCPSRIPKSWLMEYGNQDVEQTLELFKLQRNEIIHGGLLPTMFTRCLFTPVLADIEKYGIHLDGERVLQVVRKVKTRHLELTKEYNELIGNVNPRSPKQLREAIYGTLGFKIPKDYRGNEILGPSGLPSTNAKVLEKLKAKNQKQKRFLELQKELAKLNAALSKTLDKFYDCINETDTHILTASLNQTVTQTHRLSSTGKNYKAQFQNFPREYKPLINTRLPGWKVGEGDQAQLEFRVAAFLGQDKQAIEDIKNKVDVHSVTASVVFAEDWNKIQDKKSAKGKELRAEAKSRTFKPLYGGTSGTDSERAYYAYFREHYREITDTQQAWIDEVLRDKTLKTITGLRFFWPTTKLTSSGFVVNSQQICNYPVQSFATADIVPIGVVYQWHIMRACGLKSFMVNTVHDSTVSEVAPGEEEIFTEIVNLSMVDKTVEYLKKVYKIDFNVPLEAEVVIKPNWSDSEEWKEKWLND